MLDEQDPSPEYLKGFNQGYIMAQFEPDLLYKILKSLEQNSANDYILAMKKAKIQYELDQIVAEAEVQRDRRDHSHDLEP